MKKFLLCAVAMAMSAVQFCAPVQADLIISQYYEGTSFNKWIEVFNSGNTSIDLSTITVGLWSNGNREGYKTNVAPTTSNVLSGNLASGSVLLLKNSQALLPGYASGTSVGAINFNGDDSIVLYTGAVYNSANIVDAIGFAANDGADKSFVRTSLSDGYNLTAGSSVLTFPGVWSTATLAEVDNAAPGADLRLGSTALPTAVPEPTSMAVLSIAGVTAGVGAWRRRKANKAQAQA